MWASAEVEPEPAPHLHHRLLAKGQEIAGMLSDLLAGKKPSGLDLLEARPGETEEEKLHRYLDLIQSRIDAIQDGTYGRCQVCGGQIPLAELDEVPWAERCGRCAAAGAAH